MADPTQALPPGKRIGPCPIPSGAVLYADLSSAFVDAPRLLRFLAGRRHSGALVAAAGERVDVVLVDRGDVLGAVAATPAGTVRLDRLALPTPESPTEWSLTVLAYRPQVAVALGQLVAATPERQPSGGDGLEPLLSRLARDGRSGAVRVVTGDDVGIVLLRDGASLGAYSIESPELDEPEAVAALAGRPDAEVDLHLARRAAPVG